MYVSYRMSFVCKWLKNISFFQLYGVFTSKKQFASFKEVLCNNIKNGLGNTVCSGGPPLFNSNFVLLILGKSSIIRCIVLKGILQMLKGEEFESWFLSNSAKVWQNFAVRALLCKWFVSVAKKIEKKFRQMNIIYYKKASKFVKEI